MSGGSATANPTQWVEFVDKLKNKPYFYNKETKQTVWAIPPEYKAWKDGQQAGVGAGGGQGLSQTKTVFSAFLSTATPEDNSKLDAFLKTTSWRRAKNTDGRIYYFEKETKVTQWNEPQVVIDYLTEYIKSKEKAATAATVATAKAPAAAGIIKKRKAGELDMEVVVEEPSSKAQQQQQQQQLSKVGQSAMMLMGDPEGEGDDDFGVDDHDDDEEEDDVAGALESSRDLHSKDDDDDHDAMQGDGESEEEDEEEDEDEEEEEDDDMGARGEDFYDDFYGDVLPGDGAYRGRGRDDNDAAVVGVGAATGGGAEAEALRAMEMEMENEEAQIARLDAALSQRDAIMDGPRTIEAAKTMFQLTKDGSRIIRCMSEGYWGYPQMTRIVGEWLMLARRLGEDTGGEANNGPSGTFAGSAQQGSSSAGPGAASSLAAQSQSQDQSQGRPPSITPESIAAEFIATAIKQRFDKNQADQLLKRFSGTPEWLRSLMQDATYRRMFIELYDQHSDSDLLGLCLREISSMGHHREIAQVIRESEYFLVFNDLLVDMLSRVSAASAAEVSVLADDLKRSCCSSEYMFLYANRLFAEVEKRLGDEAARLLAQARAETAAAGGPPTTHITFKSSAQVRGEIFSGLRCKVRRLRQELEGAAIWRGADAGGGQAGGGRLDPTSQFALRLAGTFVSQAATQSAAIALSAAASAAGSSAPSVASLVTNELADMLKTNDMTAVHAQRLCMHFLRLSPREDASLVSITAETLQNLPAPLHLLRHPRVLRQCVDALVHPNHLVPDAATGGSQRVAKLLALACVVDDSSTELGVLTNQRTASQSSRIVSSNGNGNGNEEGSASQGGANPRTSEAKWAEQAAKVRALEVDLLQACGLCSDILRMAYGVTSFDKPTQLIDLMSWPVVSMAVLRWVDYHVKDGPLRSNPAFLSILPFFFQFLVTAIQRHPLQRPDCFSILCAILSLSSLSLADDDDAASKHVATGTYTIISVHENALECVVFLIGAGYSIIPITYLSRQAAGLDAVLLKHTLKLLLSSMHPPFSKPFATQFFGFIVDTLPTVHRWTKEEAATIVSFRDSLLLLDDDLGVDRNVIFEALEAAIAKPLAVK